MMPMMRSGHSLPLDHHAFKGLFGVSGESDRAMRWIEA